MASSSRYTRMKTAINQPRSVLILSPEQRQRFSEHFENRKVIISKYLDWSFFSSCDDLPVMSLLENLGLRNLVSWKGIWSDEIIRTFYTTLKYSIRDKSISAEVRGVKIKMSEDKLADILEIPRPSKECIYFTENYNSLCPAFYNKEEVHQIITREATYSGQEIRVTHMDASNRLLLSIIANIIFNKARNLANGSESEYLAMSCILRGVPFNIPYLIMRRMEACARRKSPLPYAAFISKILKAFNVSSQFYYDIKSQIIDGNSMRRMNFIFIDNTWKRGRENLTIKRAREIREAEEEEAEEEEEERVHEEAAEPAAQPPASGHTDALFEQILANQRNQQTMLENQQAMLQNQQAMLERQQAMLGTLDDRVGHLARELFDFRDVMHDLIKNISKD